MTLLDVIGQNHDIGNHVAAARVNADWLHKQITESNALDVDEVRAMSVDLRASLDQIANILAESKRSAREVDSRVALHEVDVTSCIERASRKIGNVAALVLDVPTNRHVVIRGGEKNLDRVIDALLSRESTVRAKDAPAGHVTIEIGDTANASRDLDEVMLLIVAASGGRFVRGNESVSLVLAKGGCKK